MAVGLHTDQLLKDGFWCTHVEAAKNGALERQILICSMSGLSVYTRTNPSFKKLEVAWPSVYTRTST